MSRLRVVNLGLPKTGTTTLARALRRAGLHTADHRIRPVQTMREDLKGRFVGALLYRNYFSTGDPLHGLDEFDAFSEISVLQGGRSFWPQTDWGVIAAILEHHPGMRFVASRRNARALSDSMLRWSNLGTERLPRGSIPGLPRGYGETSRERMIWIEAHYATLERLFDGDQAFLAYDIDDPEAPKQIARHLGIDLPWWGRANRNRGGGLAGAA